MELTKSEQWVLEELRSLSDWGEMRIVKQKGEIVQIEKTEKRKFEVRLDRRT